MTVYGWVRMKASSGGLLLGEEVAGQEGAAAVACDGDAAGVDDLTELSPWKSRIEPGLIPVIH